MPVSSRETYKVWFEKEKAKADAAAKAEADAAAAYQAEKTTWDADRAREQGAYDAYYSGLPALREKIKNAKARLAALQKPQLGLAKPFMYGSSYDQLYNYYRNVSRENESTAHRYARETYAKYAPYRTAEQQYEKALKIWKQKRADLQAQAGLVIPDAPTTPRGEFAPRVMPAPPPPRMPGPISAEALGTDPTTRYGRDFLKNYGVDILGMSPEMTDVQKMMNLSDDYYSMGDLTTGSQAARDYFATNLWDYLQKNKISGDYSAITDTPGLQNFIKDRLGLSWENYDDLMESLSANYGHTRV